VRDAAANLQNKVGDALVAAGLANGPGADGVVSIGCRSQKSLWYLTDKYEIYVEIFKTSKKTYFVTVAHYVIQYFQLSNCFSTHQFFATDCCFIIINYTTTYETTYPPPISAAQHFQKLFPNNNKDCLVAAHNW